MELTGTITQVLPMEIGTTKSGNSYSRITMLLQYDEQTQYPKTLAVTFLNKNVESNIQLMRPNTIVKVKFDVTSREYNGRYYTEAIGWKIESPTPMQQPYTPQPAPTYAAPAPAPAQTYAPPQPPVPQTIVPPPQPAYPPAQSPFGQHQQQYAQPQQTAAPTPNDLPF